MRAEYVTGYIGRPVTLAAWMIPGWTTNLGPLGPSGVNAGQKPLRDSFISSLSADAPPLVVDPRDEYMPRCFTILATNSPSLCRLIITETGRESLTNGISSILPCQKENIACVSSGGRLRISMRMVRLRAFKMKATTGGTASINTRLKYFGMLGCGRAELHIIQPLIDAALGQQFGMPSRIGYPSAAYYDYLVGIYYR